MKIINDYENGMYHIIVEYPESEFHIVTNNIFEARNYFIEHMTRVFDNTIADQFKTDK